MSKCINGNTYGNSDSIFDLDYSSKSSAGALLPARKAIFLSHLPTLEW